MNPIEELELFAKWRGYLEGRALSLEEPRRERPPQTGGRPAAVDAHAEEISAAIQAARTLEQLQKLGPQGQKHARTLLTNFVLRGELAHRRAQKKRGGLSEALRHNQQQQNIQEALDAYESQRKILLRSRTDDR